MRPRTRYTLFRLFVNTKVFVGIVFVCSATIKSVYSYSLRNITNVDMHYCHTGSQRGRVPTQVRTGRPNSEGGMGGVDPNRMKM